MPTGWCASVTEPEAVGGADRHRRRMLFLFAAGPRAGLRGREGLDAVLMAAAFDQAVTLAFIDDGVFQLLPGQDAAAAGGDDHTGGFAALHLYDVDRILVERDSLQARGLDAADLRIAVEVVDGARLGEELRAHDFLFGF